MRNPRVLAAIETSPRCSASSRGAADPGHLRGARQGRRGGPENATVENTLAILERIQAQASSVQGQAWSVRVLLAGRRPLPPRDYLAVQNVAGFTLEEAREYLATFAAAPLAPRLDDAMIRQSPAADSPGTRVSPFDLALYLAWADEDPGLDESRVLQGSDAYIEGRIIERLHDPGVLAAAAAGIRGPLPGRDDRRVHRGRRRAARPPARRTGVDRLRRRPAGARGGTGLAAGCGTTRRPGQSARVRGGDRRLGRALRSKIAGASLADVDIDELLAALRLSGPAEAARLSGVARGGPRWRAAGAGCST